MSVTRTVQLSCAKCHTTGAASWIVDGDVHTIVSLAPDFVSVGQGRDGVHYFMCAQCHAATDKMAVPPRR